MTVQENYKKDNDEESKTKDREGKTFLIIF